MTREDITRMAREAGFVGINWQCRTCGRWADPVPEETERRVIDADIRARGHG